MLVGVLSAARERGWAAEAILFESARQAEWLSDFEAAGIPVTLAPNSTKGSRLAISRWLRPRLARRPGPKVLHSHFTAWDVPSAVAAFGRRDTNVYWHVHSVLPHSAASIARGSAKFGLIGRTVTGVFCPAPNIVDAVVERRAKPERVHFLPSAVDLRLFPVARDDERLRAREALGLPADATILLHFGWDFKIKGGDYFVETVAELAKRGHDDVLGLSRGGDEQTTALADKLGVSERVRLQPPVEDARSLFAAADLLVSSSREEGMAYSVLEALCSGIPVVATNSAGNVFLGENMEACRIVSPNTAELVDAVEATLARDAETAKREPAEARDWIRDNLDVAAIANDLLDRYETDLRARGMPASRAAAGRPRRAGAPRLIQLANYRTNRSGSLVPMLAAVLSRASKRGWGAEVVLPEAVAGAKWLAELEDAGATVTLLPDLPRRVLNRALDEIVAREPGPTLMHCHFTAFDVSAALAARRRAGALAFWHHHSALSPDLWITARNLVKFGVGGRMVERIYCPAPDLCESLTNRWAPGDRVTLMPNAIDVSKFPLASIDERIAARERLGIDQDTAVLLNFAWDWVLKGGELFQRTMARLRDEGRNVVGLQIGETSEAVEWRRLLELEDQIRLLGQAQDVRALYAAADVFVATSPAEGVPFAIIEALSSGLALAATDIPGHALLAEGLDGARLAPGDPEAMASVVASLLDRPPSEVEAAGRVAHQTISEGFSLDDWAERMMAEYERALSSNGLAQTGT